MLVTCNHIRVHRSAISCYKVIMVISRRAYCIKTIHINFARADLLEFEHSVLFEPIFSGNNLKTLWILGCQQHVAVMFLHKYICITHIPICSDLNTVFLRPHILLPYMTNNIYIYIYLYIYICTLYIKHPPEHVVLTVVYYDTIRALSDKANEPRVETSTEHKQE